MNKIFLTILFCGSLFCVSGNAQDEDKISVKTRSGLLDVAITERRNNSVLVLSASLERKPIKQIQVTGTYLEILATYMSAYEGDYIVLRTDNGQGACVGTTVYVLRVNNQDGKATELVELSPILQACMGEVPTVSFAPGKNGETMVTVQGYSYITGKWVKTKNTKAK